MGKPRKKGTYEHLCILIFAQGTWKEVDRLSVLDPLRRERNLYPDDPYPFLLKLTLREEEPSYSDCSLDPFLYRILKEIQGKADGILFLGHHYLIFPDDILGIKKFTDLVLNHNKVKKFYLMYLDSLGEIKRTILSKFDLTALKNMLSFENHTRSAFIGLLDSNEFKERVIYEVTKEQYF